jgi:hypothetical protein
MEKYLLAPLLIGKLGHEDNFRNYFSRFLKFLAAICAVAALIVFFLGWKELFARSSEGMIGGIIYQLAFAFAAYLVVHCMLLRAADAAKPVPGIPATLSVAAVILKLVGEVWGVAGALLGSGAAIYVWFAGREAGILLQKTAVFFPFLEARPASFTAGASLIFQGFLYGALALLLGYLLADLLLLLPVRSDNKKSSVEK